MKIKILIATTKEYEMPQDDFHMPIQVGAAGKESIGYQRDDEGENISEKNPYYCELTGIFWAWKNLDADYVGLEHYRRRLDLNRFKSVFSALLYESDKNNSSNVSIQSLVKARESMPDLILPRRRNYYIESLYSHYAHTHYGEHLDIAAEIIDKKYPEYNGALRAVYKSTGGFMFNMFIMRKDLLDEYCTWLFDILGEMETRIDVSQYDSFQARLFGRVSEILFNVWLTKKLENEQTEEQKKHDGKEELDTAGAKKGKHAEKLKISTVKVIYLEKQHVFKKVVNLLGSKLGKKKYEKSL